MKGKTRVRLSTILAVLSALAMITAADGKASAAGKGRSSHMDRIINVEGCGGCHGGRGFPGGGLLKGRAEKLCYRCHGLDSPGRGRSGADIESVMHKMSRHPVEETSHLHNRREELPASSPIDPRHVACADCHLTHITDPEKAWNGVPGYIPGQARGRARGGVPTGIRKKMADLEYEICYRCHSDGANMGFGARDISEEFDTTNMSYHPVEMAGRNRNVPSLVTGMSEAAVIVCTSCHGNSDPNGPSGPHGSDYAPILRAEYRTSDGPESAISYTLCYLCHDRTSILADESFKGHREHVALQGLACKNCHNAHGSRDYSHLIKFDVAGITNASDGMGPLYMDGAPGTPKCFLNCHGADHNTLDINGRPWPW